MMSRHSLLLGTLMLTVAMAGCSTAGGQAPSAMEVRQGVIEQITEMPLQGAQNTGVGAILGGAAGLGLGSLIGGGSGHDVAMVLGAIGGGLLGNNVEHQQDQPTFGQQVIVRTRSGVLVSVVQPLNPVLYQGQPVYLEGGGQMARVVPQY